MFNMTNDDIDFSLEIRGWQPPTSENRHNDWCKCDMRVKIGDYLDYSVTDDEFLEFSDIVRLERELGQLLNGELTEQLFECFTELDLSFDLNPKSKYNDDVYVTMCIALRKAGTSCYNGAESSIELDRSNIESLLEYLKGVTNV